jgi:cell division septal protein FtsQ
MTTLDVQTGRLRAAVSRFPEVKGLRVSTDFPHRIVIHVLEVLPIAVVKMFGRDVPVTDDGTLLPNVSARGALPLIALSVPPSGGRLQQAWALGAARLLAAAPPSLLPRLAETMAVAGHGIVVQVRNGPSIYFGDATQVQAKWSAVLAVLANPGSAGAAYIDVTDPERPVAGATASSAATSGAAASSATTSGTTATTASTSAGTSVSGATGGTSSGTSTAPASTAAVSTSTVQTSPVTDGSAASSTAPTGG